MKLVEVTDGLVRALLDVEGCDDEALNEAIDAGLAKCNWARLPGHLTADGDALVEEARRVARGLSEYEREVLRSVVVGPRRRWGGAVGQAYECLRSSGCLTETFEAAPAGRLVLVLGDRV